MSDMAEALARQNFEREWGGVWDELPNAAKRKWVRDAQSMLDFLTTAGFGPVKEAGAVALEEAAQTIEGYAKDGADGDTSPYETATWLRARAAKICADVA